MKNKTSYNRTQHNQDNPFLVISQKLISDSRLDVTEKGIMMMLLSNSDDYVFNSNYFRKTTGLGQDKYFKCIEHLIELGYINKTRNQSGVSWVINEVSNSLENTTNETFNSTENTTNETFNSTENTTNEIEISSIGDSILEENNNEISQVVDTLISLENTTIEINTIENTTLINNKEINNKETNIYNNNIIINFKNIINNINNKRNYKNILLNIFSFNELCFLKNELDNNSIYFKSGINEAIIRNLLEDIINNYIPTEED